MGPQGKLVVGNSRYTAIPGSALEVDQQMGGKERLLSSNGSGSVSGSPGRLHDNVSRDSGIGCLKVNILSITDIVKICLFSIITLVKYRVIRIAN